MDNFSDRFSFNLVNKKEKEKDRIRTQELDKMVLCTSSSLHTALVVTDASIKDEQHCYIYIAHAHSHPSPY